MNRLKRLIFADGDDFYRGVVKAELEEEGYCVIDFANAREMLVALNAGVTADLMLLEWGLGGPASGSDLLLELRRQGFDLPVVFLAYRTSIEDELRALQQGAIDFVDKSRVTKILASRLNLVVVDKDQSSASRFECGRLVLKPDIARAYWNGVDVNLTIGEFRVVHLLAADSGAFVPYRQIYDAMHYVSFAAGYGEHGYRANVRSSIARIRDKFRGVDASFDQMKNHAGFGYSWRSN